MLPLTLSGKLIYPQIKTTKTTSGTGDKDYLSPQYLYSFCRRKSNTFDWNVKYNKPERFLQLQESGEDTNYLQLARRVYVQASPVR